MNSTLIKAFRRLQIRLLNYEHWPWGLFFMPLIPVYLYYAIRLRNPVYFTAANPGIEFGGFFGEKKNEILNELPEEYLAKSIFFDSVEVENVIQEIRANSLEYPIVFKPDVGERGDEVAIIETEENLIQHLASVTYPFIIQEYVDYPIELGVFYSRLPSAKEGRILSIVRKKFLEVTGDGKSTVEQLLANSDRGFLQIPRLQKENLTLMAEIPGANEVRLVEPLGNHCLGTEFIDNNNLINEELNRVFDTISIPFDGFNYGRYDLRVRSIEELYKGEGIYIFELNGVTSEPGHIYDKRNNLVDAYRDLIKQQTEVFKISRENLKKYGNTTKVTDILKRAYQHFLQKKR
jgi:hypothetical protein